MGFMSRLFGKQAGEDTQHRDDVARSQQLVSRETGQTSDEKDATRGRMEAELDAQRARRAPVPTPEP